MDDSLQVVANNRCDMKAMEHYLLDHEVADLLQQHNDSSWRAVEFAVHPGEADAVYHWRQCRYALIKLRLDKSTYFLLYNVLQ